MLLREVVIPIQTISFYNTSWLRVIRIMKVVIPIQTISFYNSACHRRRLVVQSCHTYPNDKLLQQSCIKDFEEVIWLQDDVSLNLKALISQDLAVSRTRFSQITCFFIVKCWVLWVLLLTISFILNGLTSLEKFANDSPDFLVWSSCEICFRFQRLFNVQKQSFFARFPRILQFIFHLRWKSINPRMP